MGKNEVIPPLFTMLTMLAACASQRPTTSADSRIVALGCPARGCGSACNAGFVSIAGTCVADAPPRPIAPLSTSTVTSQRPTLTWSVAPGFSGAVVEICRDRACASPQSTPVDGTTFRLAVALSPGVWYWRLRNHSAVGDGVAVGPVWEFTVGAHDAPVSSSGGTMCDVNGDGYADVVAGHGALALSAGVYVFHGSANGLGSLPATTLRRLDGIASGFGSAVACGGDVNGDGYADIIVGAQGAVEGRGRAYVYYGGATGTATTPATTLAGPAADGAVGSIGSDGPYGGFGGSIASAGDVNGDGYGDVIVGVFGWPGGLATGTSDSGTGRAYLFLGTASGLDSSPVTTLTGLRPRGQFARSLAGAGDVNRDGYGDIVVGAPDAVLSRGAAYIYLGSPSGLAASPSTTLVPSPDMGGYFGGSVASAGDVNGDGFADVIIGARGAEYVGGAYVYLGTSGGLSATPAALLRGLDGQHGAFGNAVATAGDVNGDGYADIVVSAVGAQALAGRVYVFMGGASGVPITPAAVLSGPGGVAGNFGRSLAGAGEVNGDGYADIIVGAVGAQARTGRIFLYSGGAEGVIQMPAQPINRPSGTDDYFGFSVASAADCLDP